MVCFGQGLQSADSYSKKMIWFFRKRLANKCMPVRFMLKLKAYMCCFLMIPHFYQAFNLETIYGPNSIHTETLLKPWAPNKL